MTHKVASFTLKAGTVVKVGGVPVHLGHDCIVITHPENGPLIDGAVKTPQIEDLDAAILRWNRGLQG